jgi:kumamolisin
VKPIAISVAGAVNGAVKAVTTAGSAEGHDTLIFGPTAIPAGFPAKSYAFAPFGNLELWPQVKDVTRSHSSTTVTLKTSLSVPVAKGTPIYFNVGNETTQDVCVAASAAPGADIAVYFAPATEQGWLEVFLRGIWPHRDDKPPSVLSCSFGYLGAAEGDDQSSNLASIIMLDSFFSLDAVVRGVTICACTGDNGSQGLPNPGDGHAHVWYPASDPNVLAVGGTTLGKTQSGEWVEYVWNDASGATGGGVSDIFDVPTYQSHMNVPHTVNPSPPFKAKGRSTPDVAANASSSSGYPMFFCGSPYTAAGTSAATPLWAGLIALINSYKPNPWGNVGCMNWQLYQFAVSFNLFNPINALWRDPHNPKLADCPTNNGYHGVKGYAATEGWDACTGWGSPNGKALLDMFKFVD